MSETGEQPPEIQLQNFEVLHEQLRLEQQLNKLSPFVAYKDLENKLEEIPQLTHTSTNEEYDNHNVLERMIRENEYGKLENPKQPSYEDWMGWYKYKYDEEEKKIPGSGCWYLLDEQKQAGQEFSRDSDQTIIRLDAVERILRDLQKEGKCIKKQHDKHERNVYEYDPLEESIREGLGGEWNRNVDKDKRCDNEDIALNHQKRLYYLKLSMNSDEYKKLNREDKKTKIQDLKTKIQTINESANAKYNEAVGLGDDEKIKEAKKNLQEALKNIGFTFKVYDKNKEEDPKLNYHLFGDNKDYNFFHTFEKNPSIDDFMKADNIIEDKCPNILDDDMYPFVPDDPSEMGGHPDAFINIYIPKNGEKKCSIYGGKKWVEDSRIEYNFYEYIYKNKEEPLLLSLKNYIPEYIEDKKCVPFTDLTTEKTLKKMHYYFPIANAENIVRKKDETVYTADFKIGYRTSFLHEKGYKRNNGGKKRDKFQSTSGRLGFRLEGSNITKKINKISRKYTKVSGWHTTPNPGTMKRVGISVKPVGKIADRLSEKRKKKLKIPQFNLYILNPGFVFDTIFYNRSDKQIKDFQVKLNVFENDFIKKNFEAFNTENKKAIAFIGSSFYFVSGENGIDFKLIDFAHPYVLSWEEKEINGKRKRILNTKDVPCCPTYLRDGLDIISTSNENNMAVKYDIPKDPFFKKHKIAITEGQKKELRNYPFNIDKSEYKRHLTYKEWEHTFFNFMSGLLSMIYSFHIWANSRFHYKKTDTNIRKRTVNTLRKKYLSYKKPVKKIKKNLLETWMDVPDNFDSSNYETDKELKKLIEETWDEPYRWDESSKITQFNELLNNSQSNLLNANL